MLPRSLNTYSKQIIFKFDIQQSTSTCFLDNCWKIHYRRTMRKLVWEMLLLWTPTNLSKNHGRPKLYAIASFLLKNINERKTIIELGGKSQNERGKPSCFTYMISLKRITIYIAQVAPFPLFSTLNTRNKTLWVVFLETNIKPLLRKKILNHFFDVWLNGGIYLPTRVWPTICFWLPLCSCWLWLARFFRQDYLPFQFHFSSHPS